MPTPAPITVPDYNTPPAGSTPTSSTSTSDIWGLGQLYGMPVYAGMAPQLSDIQAAAVQRGEMPIPLEDADARGYNPGSEGWGSTQKWISNIKDLWAKGSSGDDSAKTDYADLQLLLFQNGAFGATALKDIRFGQWNAQTEKAIVNALQGYEQAVGYDKDTGTATPITFHDYLQMNRDNGSVDGTSTQDPTAGGGSGGAGGAARQTVLADPLAIRASATAAAQAALGQGLSEDQLNQFVQHFQGAQAAYQQSNDGTVTSPNLDAQAGQFAQQVDPQQYSNHQAQGYMDALLNMFLPSGSQRANIAPVASA